MSQWIIGGFFAVGIIALLGAIFLGLSERTPLVRSPQEKPGPDSTPATPAVANDAAETPEQAPQELASAPVAASQLETTTPQPEQVAPALEEEQLQDLSAELHGLHEQAARMKERVHAIVETVEGVEKEQENSEEEHASTEEAE